MAWGIPPSSYRAPDASHIGRVRLQVSDIARSVPFYTDLLGFHTLEQSAGRVKLGTHGAGTPLVELCERNGATPVPPQGRLGLYHFAILLPDRRSLGSFLAHLSALRLRPGMADHLVSEALYLNDPDGLGIEVYADRPRSDWQATGRELKMATLPLDVRALLRTADGHPWRGMPAGTTIGHVHLHVADLDAASDFYHEGLGLDRVVWSYPGALFLSAGGYHHHLGLNTWAARAAPAREHDARLLEWELIVPSEDDVVAAAESLAARGAQVRELGPDRLVDDPWGTTLRLRHA